MLFVHPSDKNSDGKQVVTTPLTLFCDDTSGNRSKKWNGFNVWSLMLASLTKTDNAKLKNIHLLTFSNFVSPLEMAKPIVDDLISLEEGMVMYDAFLKEDMLVVAPVMSLLADNPRASELVNHMGSTTQKYCRICKVCNV